MQSVAFLFCSFCEKLACYIFFTRINQQKLCGKFTSVISSKKKAVLKSDCVSSTLFIHSKPRRQSHDTRGICQSKYFIVHGNDMDINYLTCSSRVMNVAEKVKFLSMYRIRAGNLTQMIQ